MSRTEDLDKYREFATNSSHRALQDATEASLARRGKHYVFTEEEFKVIILKVTRGETSLSVIHPPITEEERLPIEEMIIAKLERDYRTREGISHGGSTSHGVEDSQHKVDWYENLVNSDEVFWTRYKAKVSQDLGLSAERLIDRSTNDIMAGLGDPRRPQFNRRGLVVGNVQSGKTANMAGVVAKAFDAGYKDVIILAGPWNELRSQTQLRMCEDIAGYVITKDDNVKKAGVGIRAQGKKLPDLKADCATITTLSGDFSKVNASNALKDMFPATRCRIFVVKKHVSILTNLLEWLQKERETEREDGGEGSLHESSRPALVIDDECDHYSVDTSDPEEDPKKVNSCIRRLIGPEGISKVSYIGYTATPAANCLINRNSKTPELGDDLFPRDFMHVLETPPNYLGIENLFGSFDDGRENGDGTWEDLDKDPTVENDFMPPEFKNGDNVGDLPDSLKQAVQDFILGTAGKWIRDNRHDGIEREGGKAPTSMLVHVSVNVDPQSQICTKVQKYVTDLTNILKVTSSNNVWEDLRARWEDEFQKKTLEMEEIIGGEASFIPWEEIEEKILHIAKEKRIGVRMNNSLNPTTMDWDEVEGKGVIFIGGMTLSRGVTLKNLIVSYFIKRVKKPVYDTLMQMGRWFGYKPRFRDLSRIYVNNDIHSKFKDIAITEIDLRNRIRLMNEEGKTPKEISLEIKVAEGGMLTSLAKQKNPDIEKVNQSAWGAFKGIHSYLTDEDVLSHNKEAVCNLMDNMGNRELISDLLEATENRDIFDKPAFRNSLTNGSHVHYYRNVHKQAVCDFLKAYKGDDGIASFSSFTAKGLLAQLERHDDFANNWTVILRGLDENNDNEHGKVSLNNISFDLVKRSDNTKLDEAGILSEGRIRFSTATGKKSDRVADVLLDLAHSDKAVRSKYEELSDKGNPDRLRTIRNPNSAVLVIQPFRGYVSIENNPPLNHQTPFFAIGVGLPRNNESYDVYRNPVGEEVDDA